MIAMNDTLTTEQPGRMTVYDINGLQVAGSGAVLTTGNPYLSTKCVTKLVQLNGLGARRPSLKVNPQQMTPGEKSQ